MREHIVIKPIRAEHHGKLKPNFGEAKIHGKELEMDDYD